MNACFADTYFFIALLFANDDAHMEAEAIARGPSQRLWTTAWVLTELGDALALPERRKMFVPFLGLLKSNSLVTIVPAEQGLFERGVALYERRADKEWSLTDCISFVVMSENGLKDALTGDHHFEQAGFSILMKRN